MRLPYRILATVSGLVVAATLVGCEGESPKPAPAAPAQVPPKAPPVEPAVKDMKPPAETKPAETKAGADGTVDSLPPLVPPAGGKDDRPDANPR